MTTFPMWIRHGGTFGPNLNYIGGSLVGKAWRAREATYETLQGTPEESYTFLPSFLHVMVEYNPGGMTDLVVACEGRFKLVICVDMPHLKGKYMGMMFTAVCKDSNNSIFSMAWGIGDVENDSLWLWFFTKLKQVYNNRPGLVIVSDRHPSISKAIYQVYLDAFHEICMQHLLQNIKNKFRGISVDMLYYWCVKAYCLCEFEHLLHTLMLVEQCLGPYLQDVGYEGWSRAYSRGRQYNIMTTNISEWINAILVKNRELPITALAEELRSLVQRWHYEQQTEVEKCKMKLTLSAEALLAKQYQLSLRMRLDPKCETVYTVFDGDKNGVVDMQARTCSCRRFQLEQLPCAHAMIVIQHLRGDVYDFCFDYYLSECWKAIYTSVVYLLPHQANWVVPNEIRENKLLSPDARSISGRRRKHQIPFVGETIQYHKCSRCCQTGHHHKTCQNPVPLHPNQVSTSMEMPSINLSHTF
ncbi:hypothetical protein UlMin_035111 [Ulmus minor]